MEWSLTHDSFNDLQDLYGTPEVDVISAPTIISQCLARSPHWQVGQMHSQLTGPDDLLRTSSLLRHQRFYPGLWNSQEIQEPCPAHSASGRLNPGALNLYIGAGTLYSNRTDLRGSRSGIFLVLLRFSCVALLSKYMKLSLTDHVTEVVIAGLLTSPVCLATRFSSNFWCPQRSSMSERVVLDFLHQMFHACRRQASTLSSREGELVDPLWHGFT